MSESPPIPAIAVISSSGLDDSLVTDLASDFRDLNVEVLTDRLEQGLAYASLTWTAPTTVLVIAILSQMSGGFFGELGMDQYKALKGIVRKTYARFLSPTRPVRTTVVATKGKVEDSPTFALEFSIEAVIARGQRVRLVFPSGLSFEDAFDGAKAFFDLLEAFHSGRENELVCNLKTEMTKSGWTKLVYYEAARRELLIVDLLRSVREKRLIAVDATKSGR